MTLVATANVLSALDRVDAGAALADVLEHRPDLVGLQEWGPSRRGLLRREPAYAWVAPVYGGNAIGFRRDRYRLLAHRLAPLALLGRADPGVRPVPVLPPRLATVARLLERRTDVAISVVSYHLVPGVQRRGRYRADRPLLVSRHRLETLRLSSVVGERLAAGDVVHAMGDSNLDGFVLPGLTSAWAGRRDDPAGTLGSCRKVDDVFGPGPAESVQLLRSASDHAAVLVGRADRA
ncbi:MAG: hypothetical protein JWO46_174 [Nocardioidaceae bacterium]|nr:hypothetical protein [Nocardioidaceae bacterium]